MTAHEVLASLPAVSCDFWFVTNLIDRNLLFEECRAYLAEALKKADREGDRGVAEKAKMLLLRLPEASP